MKKSSALSFALVGYAIYTVIRFGIVAGHSPGIIPTDFTISLRACERLVHHEWFYQHDDSSPFKYSPSFLLLFYATFYQLEKHWAWALWVTLSIGTFVWTSWGLVQSSFRNASIRTWKLLAVLSAFLLFGFHGYLEHFSYGQVDYLIFSAFLGAVLASPWAAALLMGLALITKPQAGILLAYFFIQRQWKTLAKIGVTTFALLFFPVLVWGFARQLYLFHEWKYCIVMQQTPEFMVGNLNQNPAAILARLSGNPASMLTWSWILLALGGAAVLAATSSLKKRLEPAARARLACVVLMLYCVVTPLSWRWLTFIWTPVGVILGLDALRRSAPHSLRALLAAFAALGLVLQSPIAHAIGIEEMDTLSFIGLYGLGNILLFAAAAIDFKSYLSKTPSEV